MKTFILSVLIGISTTVYAQSKECSKFKNGKFLIEDPNYGNSQIVRKGSKQTEYGESSQLKMKFKVEWLDECTYTLTPNKVIKNPKNIEFPMEMVVRVEIIEVKENSYIQRSTSNTSNYEVIKEVKKLD